MSVSLPRGRSSFDLQVKRPAVDVIIVKPTLPQSMSSPAIAKYMKNKNSIEFRFAMSSSPSFLHQELDKASESTLTEWIKLLFANPQKLIDLKTDKHGLRGLSELATLLTTHKRTRLEIVKEIASRHEDRHPTFHHGEPRYENSFLGYYLDDHSFSSFYDNSDVAAACLFAWINGSRITLDSIDSSSKGEEMNALNELLEEDGFFWMKCLALHLKGPREWKIGRCQMTENEDGSYEYSQEIFNEVRYKSTTTVLPNLRK